jgi:hypothetical protein
MTGHGSPKFVVSIITARCLFVLMFSAALFWALMPRPALAMMQNRDSVQPSTLALKSPTKLLPNANVVRFDSEVESGLAENQNLRFRISWGGGLPQTWAGTVTVVNGELSDPTPLGLEAEANATIEKSGNVLNVHQWSKTTYGGFDVTLTGTSETRVILDLSSVEQPASRYEQTLSLKQLLSGVIAGEIDSIGNRCSIARVPGDELGVSFPRQHLVFASEEEFEFSIAPNRTPFLSRGVTCRIKMVSANPAGIVGGRSLISKSLSYQTNSIGSAPPQPVKVTLPLKEGVYNIEIELEQQRYQASFSSRKPPVSRSIQVLVLSSESAKSNQKAWESIYSTDLLGKAEANSPWSQLAQLANLKHPKIFGNNRYTPVQVKGREMGELAPGGWQAIPVTVGELGQPHIIEIEYLAEEETAIGVSFLQPDANGQVPNYGFDSGVHIEKSLMPRSKNGIQSRRLSLTVWPETSSPYLLIANRHQTDKAVIGTVEIKAGPDRLPSNGNPMPPKKANRKVMAFYEMPLFSENFGVSEKIDPLVSEPLDDWQVFHEGATRFIEYLKANGYGGAFVTVASDGSSIYPSELLLPSPKHDTGVFFTNGQDPIRKDVLEMLFRMFEREGLVLVPTLALSGPLPEVETGRRRDGTDSDFDMYDLNGKRREFSKSNNRLPIYNPLNPLVQRSVRRIVSELSNRYRSYQAFEGVSIICRPDTYTLLPGRHWGYDSLTIQRFIQAQPDLSGVPKDWSEMQGILLGTHRDQWIQWRAAQMRHWYQDLADEVRRAKPTGKLYLAPVDLYRNDETASAFSPSLHVNPDFKKIMLFMGFDDQLSAVAASQENQGELILLKPHRVAPGQSLASQRVDSNVENSSQAKQFFSNLNYSGDIFTNRSTWAHFAQLEEQVPFGEQQSPLMRLQPMSQGNGLSRQRFLQSIKNRDSRMLVDGGVTLTFGQESELQELITVFARLPDVPFKDVLSERFPKPELGHLAVRQLEFENETYFYVANASPWPNRVRLSLNGKTSPVEKIESFSDSRFDVVRVPRASTLPGSAAADKSTNNSEAGIEDLNSQVTFEIPAYGLLGGKMASGAKVTDFDFALPEAADNALQRHVFTLKSKLTKSANPQPLGVLENNGFEFDGQSNFIGWSTIPQAKGYVELINHPESSDRSVTQGVASLRLTGGDDLTVWVRSNKFEVTETGRVSISVWLKTEDPARQPPLRLALDGQSEGVSYYRFGSVGSLSPDPKANQIESRWKRFAVHFDDLPSEGLTDVRIGFDLMGPGQVSIDNVQVFDRWFDENDVKAMTQMLASTAPLLSDPIGYERCRQLLTSYWPQFLDRFIALQEIPSEPSGQAVKDGTGSVRTKRSETRGRQEGFDEIQEIEEPKVPMFRRIRNLVPQRKSPVK